MQEDQPSRPEGRDARKEKRISSKKLTPTTETSELEGAREADDSGETSAPISILSSARHQPPGTLGGDR